MKFPGAAKRKTASFIRRVPFFNTGDRGRTDTISLPPDFESDASANSATPASA